MQKSMLRALAVISALVVAGCLPANNERSEAIPLPLTGPEISKRLAGNSVYRKGWQGLASWQYASHHNDDGTLAARSWWLGGREDARGRWEITTDDLYCRVWANHWAQGERGCFRVFDSGADGSLVFDHVSGHPGDSKRYNYQILAGNPYSL